MVYPQRMFYLRQCSALVCSGVGIHPSAGPIPAVLGVVKRYLPGIRISKGRFS
jgi:hypothetical protein